MNETHKDSIIRLILLAMPDVRAIYLFGSWGKPFQREESDIDVAILPAGPVDNVRRWELAQEVARSVKRDVDLVNLLGASTVLRCQVLTHGERIYCRDRVEAESFESRILSDYVRLNEARHGILNSIREMGSVYAR